MLYCRNSLGIDCHRRPNRYHSNRTRRSLRGRSTWRTLDGVRTALRMITARVVIPTYRTSFLFTGIWRGSPVKRSKNRVSASCHCLFAAWTSQINSPIVSPLELATPPRTTSSRAATAACSGRHDDPDARATCRAGSLREEASRCRVNHFKGNSVGHRGLRDNGRPGVGDQTHRQRACRRDSCDESGGVDYGCQSPFEFVATEPIESGAWCDSCTIDSGGPAYGQTSPETLSIVGIVKGAIPKAKREKMIPPCQRTGNCGCGSIYSDAIEYQSIP